MSIRVLAPDTIAKIAAGEVVERPASVVKELVENSLDAGATHIDIEIKGGTNWIRVTDNGTGIPRDEAELAFQRHATSKITSLADLENGTSLGFRGEALPSIAHVAQVEMVTRHEQETSGTYLRLQDGRVVDRGIRAHPQGTTITVRNLFRNVPARLKYLKSLAAENGQISNVASQYSLAFPVVRFTLVIDGRRALQTPGNGRLRDVLAEVYGLQVAQAMLEVGKAEKQGGFTPVISGYASPSSISRANRSYITFLVNQRWIQSRLLTRAVEKAYEGLLGVGRYPIAVINLSLPPHSIDVNVHPTKREIRFAQEPIVFNTVYGAVRRTLMEKMPVPEVGPSPHPLPTTEEPAPGFATRATREERPALLSPISPATPARAAPSSVIPALHVLGQSAATYIIAEGPDGVYLIDQHAAHERILFEKVMVQQARKEVEVQSLLEPLTIELSPRQEQLLSVREETLSRFGFVIEPFGERACLLRAVPAMLAREGLAEAVKEILDSLEEEDDLSKREEKVAMSLACHGAVRAGQALSQEEMRELVKQLEKATSPRTCPHGRPTMLHLSSGRLQREFGRG
ncbi:MAG: DNA mismatch repair endonuclease MutL [Chloroflexi bacterium]|nr:DNA mismatch repair endonuclease MutL [Chloroflexota bacterium]